MGFPSARGHAIRPEQGCGDGAIACAALAGVKRAQGLDQAVAPLSRQSPEGWSWWSAGKGAPQAPCRVGAEFEEIVEWKLCRIARAETRPLPQPYAMVDVLSPQQDVPAVGCLADYVVGQVAQADNRLAQRPPSDGSSAIAHCAGAMLERRWPIASCRGRAVRSSSIVPRRGLQGDCECEVSVTLEPSLRLRQNSSRSNVVVNAMGPSTIPDAPNSCRPPIIAMKVGAV